MLIGRQSNFYQLIQNSTLLVPLIELENQWNQAECSEENIQKGSDKIKQKVAMTSLNKCWPVEKAIFK